MIVLESQQEVSPLDIPPAAPSLTHTSTVCGAGGYVGLLHVFRERESERANERERRKREKREKQRKEGEAGSSCSQ